MTGDEALRICRILAETYRRDDWSKERYGIWTALLADMAFGPTLDAVQGWIRNEKWPPTIAEIRDLTEATLEGQVERRRMEEATAVRLALTAGPSGPSGTFTRDQLHLWRAVLGKPITDCDCEPCSQARSFLTRERTIHSPEGSQS